MMVALMMMTMIIVIMGRLCLTFMVTYLLFVDVMVRMTEIGRRVASQLSSSPVRSRMKECLAGLRVSVFVVDSFVFHLPFFSLDSFLLHLLYWRSLRTSASQP